LAWLSVAWVGSCGGYDIVTVEPAIGHRAIRP
jgi:hypothetical protein